MSRRSEVASSYEKQAEMYLEWKSDDKSFSYYDKAQGKNITVDPGKFLFLMDRSTIKGWSESDQSGIYSNEVKNLSTDDLNVRTFSGKAIASGKYADIKEAIAKAGGTFTKSIYAMMEDGTIINFQLRGVSLRQWMDFTAKSRRRLPDEWITIASVEEGKKGRVTFSFPIFEFSGSLNSKEGDLADQQYNELKRKIEPSERIADNQADQEVIADDEIDF
jgi:hypothetical protein